MLGNLVGSWIAYAVGYYARLDLLERNRLIHISPKHLKWADDWFERYGDATVFFTRMLPIIRTFISLPAGVAKMPFWRFTAFTLAGCIPWVLMLALIGRGVGDNWEQWRHNLGYLDYVVLAAIVGGVVYLLIRRRRSGGGDGEARGEERGRERRAGRRRGVPLSGAADGRIPAPAPWRWGSSRGRPSCCRSPARPTSSSSPGWRAGTGSGSTPSCARASRSRCTAAPRRRC